MKNPVVLAKEIILPDGSVVSNPHFFVVLAKEDNHFTGKMITHSDKGVPKRKTDKSEFAGFEPDEDSYITISPKCKTHQNNIKKDETGKKCKLFGWFFS